MPHRRTRVPQRCRKVVRRKRVKAYKRSIAFPLALTVTWIARHETDGWSSAGDFTDCIVFISLNPLSGFVAGSRLLRAKNKGYRIVKTSKSRLS